MFELLDDEICIIDEIKGDEFLFGVQVIIFKLMVQMLGYDSVYWFEFVEGCYVCCYDINGVSEVISIGIQLYENFGFDVYILVWEQGSWFGIGIGCKDVSFGLVVYVLMVDGLEYEVLIM